MAWIGAGTSPAVSAWGVISVVIAWWHIHFGLIQYGGFDGGILINTAWQQYLGAEPYRDFFTPTPPLFVFPAGWAFELFGPTWFSLLIITALFSVGTFTWEWLLFLRAGLNSFESLLLSFATQAITMMTFSWWWYNQVTSVIATIFVASSFLLLMRPGDVWSRASFWAAEFLLAMAKSNVAGPLLIGFVIVLVWEKSTRRFTLISTLTGALAAMAFLEIHGISVPLLLKNYLALSDRLWTPQRWVGNSLADIDDNVNNVCFPCIALILISPLILFRQMLATGTKKIPVCGIFALGILASLSSFMGMAINCDLKMIEVARTLVAVVMMTLFLRKTQAEIRPNILPYVAAFAFVLVITGLEIGYLRLRVFSIGPIRYAENTRLKKISGPAFFHDMQVGPIFEKTVGDIADVLAKEGWPENRHLKIFIGPRIDCCYAAFGVPVESGLPIWWEKVPSTHHGETIPEGDGNGRDDPRRQPSRWIREGEPLDPQVQRFINARFDLCLFCISPDGIPNLILMPPDLRAELYAHYHIEYHGTIAVFRRTGSN